MRKAIVFLTVSVASGGNTVPTDGASADGTSCAFRRCGRSGFFGGFNFDTCYSSQITAGDYGQPAPFPASAQCTGVDRTAMQLSCSQRVRIGVCSAAQAKNCEMFCIEEVWDPVANAGVRPGCVGAFPSWIQDNKAVSPTDVGKLTAQLADATCTIGGNCTLRCASRVERGKFGACAAFNTSLWPAVYNPWVIYGAGTLVPPRDSNDHGKTAARFNELQLRPSVFWAASTATGKEWRGLSSLTDRPPLTGGFPGREGLTVECTEQNSCKGLNVVCPRYSTCEVNCRNAAPGDGVCGTKDEPLIVFAYADSPVSVRCNAAVALSDNSCFFVLQDADELHMAPREKAYDPNEIFRVQYDILMTYVARYPPLSRALFPPRYGASSFRNRTCMWRTDPSDKAPSPSPRGDGARPDAARWSCGDAGDMCVPDPAQCPRLTEKLKKVVLTSVLNVVGQDLAPAATALAAGGGTELTILGQGFKPLLTSADPVVKLVFRNGLVVTIDDYSAASTNTQVSVVIPNLFLALGGAAALANNATVAEGVVLTISVNGVAQPLAATTPMSVHRQLIEAATPGPEGTTNGGHQLYVVGLGFGDNRSVARDGDFAVFLDRYVWDPALGQGGAKTTVRSVCPLVAKYTDSLLSCTAPAGGGVNEVVIVVNETYANFGAGGEHAITYTYPSPHIETVSLLHGCANESAALLDGGGGCAETVAGAGALSVPFGNGSIVLQVTGSNFGTASMWNAWTSSSCGANASTAGVKLCIGLQRRAGELGARSSSGAAPEATRYVRCGAVRFDAALFPLGTLRCAFFISFVCSFRCLVC